MRKLTGSHTFRESSSSKRIVQPISIFFIVLFPLTLKDRTYYPIYVQAARKLKGLLTDPSYTPSYEEKRLAIRILGIRVTIFPTLGEYPYRYHIGVTVPAIMEKLSCSTNNG
jgi:hypothetical protein